MIYFLSESEKKTAIKEYIGFKGSAGRLLSVP